jgi:hypothetical protein
MHIWHWKPGLSIDHAASTTVDYLNPDSRNSGPIGLYSFCAVFLCADVWVPEPAMRHHRLRHWLCVLV